MNCRRAVGLLDALAVGRGDLVSLVGGGGKTTLMYRLAGELRGAGLRAAAATTTKIAPPAPGDPCELLLADRYEELTAKLGDGFGRFVLGRKLLGETKVEGIPTDWCDRLMAEQRLDCLVVEADGAARKPLKAPEAWEPVVPEATTLFVALIGLDGLDAPLTAETAFRPELVARCTGLAEGDPVTAPALARLLAAPDGLAKGRPKGARGAVVLNQVDALGQAGAHGRVDADRMEKAREIAQTLSGGIHDRVLIAALGRDHTVEEVWES